LRLYNWTKENFAMTVLTNCGRPECERRLHTRIEERITWRVATTIGGLLGVGIVASFAFATYLDAGNVRLHNKADVRLERVEAKTDAMLLAVVGPDKFQQIKAEIEEKIRR
jgi:hypothetical protein